MSRHLVDFAQVITHRFPLDGIQEALELGARQAASSKITLVM
jgi:threonine dehydrogenase-like Zn-dependent dehydrogenase